MVINIRQGRECEVRRMKRHIGLNPLEEKPEKVAPIRSKNNRKGSWLTTPGT